MSMILLEPANTILYGSVEDQAADHPINGVLNNFNDCDCGHLGRSVDLVASLLVNLGFCRIRFWYFQGEQSQALLESHRRRCEPPPGGISSMTRGPFIAPVEE